MQTQKTYNTQRGARRYFGKDLTNLEEENTRNLLSRNQRNLDQDSAILAKKNGASSLSTHSVSGNSQTRYKMSNPDLLGKKVQNHQNSPQLLNQPVASSVAKQVLSKNFTKTSQGGNVVLGDSQSIRWPAPGYAGAAQQRISEYSQQEACTVGPILEDQPRNAYCPSPAHLQHPKAQSTQQGQFVHSRNASGMNRESLTSSNNLVSGTPNQQLSWTPIVHQGHHEYLQAAAHKPGATVLSWENLQEMSVDKPELVWRRKMAEEGLENTSEAAGVGHGYPLANYRLIRNSSQISVDQPSQYTGNQMQEEVIPSRYHHNTSSSPINSVMLSSPSRQTQSPIWEEPVQRAVEKQSRHSNLVYLHQESIAEPGADFIDFNGIPFSKIWGHLLSAKYTNACKSLYLQQHRDINEDMRDIVIDWLVDVHRKFKMKTETLFQALSLMDRYLERNEIKKEIFQLVATTCLFITSKFEEIYPPVLEDFVYICADTYTKNEIIHMESLVLNDIGFRLVGSTSHTLLGIYATQSKCMPDCRGVDQEAV